MRSGLVELQCTSLSPLQKDEAQTPLRVYLPHLVFAEELWLTDAVLESGVTQSSVSDIQDKDTEWCLMRLWSWSKET